MTQETCVVNGSCLGSRFCRSKLSKIYMIEYIDLYRQLYPGIIACLVLNEIQLLVVGKEDQNNGHKNFIALSKYLLLDLVCYLINGLILIVAQHY